MEQSLDFLSISPEEHPRSSPDWPLQVCRWGINYLGTTDFCSINLPNVDAELRKAFVQTLARPQEVFFVEKVAAGRQILSYSSGLSCSAVMLFHFLYAHFYSCINIRSFARVPRPIAGGLMHI